MEVEEAMLFRAPPGLPDPLIEEARIRESMLGCQTDVTAKAERLHPRYKQMKDERAFEGIVSDKSSSEVGDQKILSILSWNAGPKRGKVTHSMVEVLPCDHVQEAQTVCHEIITNAEQRFHIHQGADQLILFHKNTFKLDGVKIQEEFSGTSKRDSFWPEIRLGQVKDQEMAEGGEQHVHSRLCTLEQHDSEEARHCKATFGPARTSRREKPCRRSLQATPTLAAYRERGKAKVSSIEEVWEETLLIRPQDLGEMEGIRRLLRLHANKER